MNVLRVAIKVVLFLIGGYLLLSGLYCGAMGLGMAQGAGFLMAGIGIAFAALGGFLLKLAFKRKPDAPRLPDGQAGDGDS